MNLNREIIKRRNHGRKIMNKYKIELLKLINGEFENSRLTSLEKYDNISKAIESQNYSLQFKLLKKFDFKLDPLNVLCLDKKNDVLLRTKYSQYCGIYVLNNIDSFNFSFGFNDEHSGLITLIDKYYRWKIIIDFYEEKNVRLFELEYYTLTE